MFWQTFLSTFGLVFLAELGDKTQLATMLLVAQEKSPLAVFAGSASALVVSSLIGVVAGVAISKLIPPNIIQNVAAVAFIVLGVLMLTGKI
ncbi:MAG: TMEM165/GDT1 family protein [Firmicutes bacterium]|nr:TMEM165/GDT1 family protein [Bacillota bacterium]